MHVLSDLLYDEGVRFRGEVRERVEGRYETVDEETPPRVAANDHPLLIFSESSWNPVDWAKDGLTKYSGNFFEDWKATLKVRDMLLSRDRVHTRILLVSLVSNPRRLLVRRGSGLGPLRLRPVRTAPAH